MIPRRLVEHLRRQEWTAIAIEFVIVVIGVFVGLQMSNWNDTRIQAAEEEATLQRLQEEFGAIEAELIRVADQYSATVESTGLVIRALRGGTPPPDEAAFRDMLRAAQFVWDVPAQSTTYAELVATGALSRLSDPELRAALTRYGDYSARYARKLPVALSVVLDPRSNFLRAVDWNVDPDTWQTSEGVVGYDWTVLLDSEPELQSWQAYQMDLRDYTRGQLDELQTVLTLLGTHDAP